MIKNQGLDEITEDIIREDIKKVRNYAEEVDGSNKYLYLAIDVSKLLYVNHYRKSIGSYLEPDEKVKSYITSKKKMVTLLTIKGIHRFINERYVKQNGKAPNKIICDFFRYNPEQNLEKSIQTHKIRSLGKSELEDNIYVKKLKNIIYVKENIVVNWPIPRTNKTIDVFFPDRGIAILFESKRVRSVIKDFKRKSILSNIKKECPLFKGEINWICFTEYNRSHATKDFLKLVGSINTILLG